MILRAIVCLLVVSSLSSCSSSPSSGEITKDTLLGTWIISGMKFESKDSKLQTVEFKTDKDGYFRGYTDSKRSRVKNFFTIDNEKVTTTALKPYGTKYYQESMKYTFANSSFTWVENKSGGESSVITTKLSGPDLLLVSQSEDGTSIISLRRSSVSEVDQAVSGRSMVTGFISDYSDDRLDYKIDLKGDGASDVRFEKAIGRRPKNADSVYCHLDKEKTLYVSASEQGDRKSKESDSYLSFRIGKFDAGLSENIGTVKISGKDSDRSSVWMSAKKQFEDAGISHVSTEKDTTECTYELSMNDDLLKGKFSCSPLQAYDLKYTKKWSGTVSGSFSCDLMRAKELSSNR